MEWLQFLIMIVSMTGMFLWNRSEANADRRSYIEMMRAYQMETHGYQLSLSAQLRGMEAAIQQEMKDFHGRLCTIEERNKK